MKTFGHGDPDDARDAVLLDGVGDVRQAQRLSPRGLQQTPAYLRNRRGRLADRLREMGGDPGVLVESDDAASLCEEVLRLEQEIDAARARKIAEPVLRLDEPGFGEVGLDEPFGDELAAE